MRANLPPRSPAAAALGLLLAAVVACSGSGPGTIGRGELVPLPDTAPRDTRRGRDVQRDGGADTPAPSDGEPTDTGPGADAAPPRDTTVDGDTALPADVVPPPDAVPQSDADHPTDALPPGDADPPTDAAGDADPPADVVDAGPPIPIRAATWNVHFFWDDVCQSGECGGGDFEVELSGEAFFARADAVAASIRGLGADVVCLQEIESQRGLDAIATRLSATHPVAVLGETGYPASVDVAVVSRGQLVEVRTHRDDPLPLPGGGTTYFSRELLEVHLRIDGAPVVVFCAHFRSKHDDEPDRRLAEAQATHAFVTTTAWERPEALVLLAGDLNDTPGSPPLDALAADGRLHRVAGELADDGDATYWFDGPIAIDHLFHATEASGAYVPGSAEVLTDRPGWLQYGESDHAALRADFVIETSR